MSTAPSETPGHSASSLARRVDRITQTVALIGFSGLVVMALMTFYDGTARTLSWPRVTGFDDYGEIVYPIVIASCFPAVLLRQTNVTVRIFASFIGERAVKWLEALAALVTLLFFAALVWQLILLTANYFEAGRATRTVEMPLAPWWTVASAIMVLCVPVQAYVTYAWFRAAITHKPAEIEGLAETTGI